MLNFLTFYLTFRTLKVLGSRESDGNKKSKELKSYIFKVED